MQISAFGERVHTLRRRRGLTLAQLGEEIDVHKNTLARLERGEIQYLRTDSVMRIAEFFDVKLSYLVGMSPIEGRHEDDLVMMPAGLAMVGA